MSIILELEQFNTLEQLNKRNIFSDYIKTLIEESEKIIKLEELRADIGDELFNSLSDEEKKFIIETEGIVDFGYELTEEDLKRITKAIEEEYEY